MRLQRRRAVRGAALAAVLAAVTAGPALQASADDTTPVVTFQQSSLQVEFGQNWNFTAVGTNTVLLVAPWRGTSTISGPTAVTPVVYSNTSYDTNTTTVSIFTPSDQGPIDAGTYTVNATVTSENSGGSWDAAPASLIVAPAKLGIEVRLTADPAAPANAILTARFTGRFADEFVPAEYPNSAHAPAGIWRLVIKDAQGDAVLDESVDRAEGGNLLGTSLYWTGAQAGAAYVASASFEPSGAASKNFAVTAGETFPFTAGSIERPVPTSTATAAPPVPLPDPEAASSGIALPIWAFAVVGIVIAGLIAVVVVLFVRLRRRAVVAVLEVEA